MPCISVTITLLFQKIFTLPGDNVRIRAYMDAANLFNTLTIFTRNQFFGGGGALGPDYFRPIALNEGRVLTWGAQISF